MARHVIHAARGRGGWLKECVHRLQMPDYWGGGRHHVGALCTDTEIAIREDGCGPACGDLPLTRNRRLTADYTRLPESSAKCCSH